MLLGAGLAGLALPTPPKVPPAYVMTLKAEFNEETQLWIATVDPMDAHGANITLSSKWRQL